MKVILCLLKQNWSEASGCMACSALPLEVAECTGIQQHIFLLMDLPRPFMPHLFPLSENGIMLVVNPWCSFTRDDDDEQWKHDNWGYA